jgi:hypothetical protein
MVLTARAAVPSLEQFSFCSPEAFEGFDRAAMPLEAQP